MMEQRVNIEKTQPEVWKAMYAMSLAVSKSSLTNVQQELIKIRASQINSCAFCINMHTKDALKMGETQQRIFLLGAWRETDLFSAEEKALLALTEEVTLIQKEGVSAGTYNEALQYFSAEAIGEIICSAVMINAWNRIAVSTHMPLGR
jgi:AhpD family alkylhydroperoxidase